MNSERPADLCSGPQDAGKNAWQDAEKLPAGCREKCPAGCRKKVVDYLAVI